MRPAVPGLVRVRRLALAVLCTAALTGCGTLPLPGFGDDGGEERTASLTDWREWEPPSTDRRVDVSGGPWDAQGLLARPLDACELVTAEELREIVPDVTSVELQPRPGGVGGADAGSTSCAVVVDSEAIPEGAGPYSFALDVLAARPDVVRRELAGARAAALAGSDPRDYGDALGGGAWGGGHRMVTRPADELVVQMRSIGRVNGVGWTVPTTEFGRTSAAEVNERWRAAVFTKVAKAVAGKTAAR